MHRSFHKTVYKRRDTKFRVATLKKKSLELNVWEWWRDKLQQKRLFKDDGSFIQGLDYYGELPWPDEVSLKALYQDFVAMRPDSPVPTKLQFARLFRNVSGVCQSKSRDVSPRKENGRPFMYITSVFYHIGKFNS